MRACKNGWPVGAIHRPSPRREEKFKPLIEGGKVIEAEGVMLKLPPISLYGTEMFYTQKGRQDPRDLPG
jgi:hypothetical protein